MDDAEVRKIAAEAAREASRAFGDARAVARRDPMVSAIEVALALQIAEEDEVDIAAEAAAEAASSGTAADLTRGRQAKALVGWSPRVAVGLSFGLVAVCGALLIWITIQNTRREDRLAANVRLLEGRVRSAEAAQGALSLRTKQDSEDLASLAGLVPVRPSLGLRQLPRTAGLSMFALVGPDRTAIDTTTPTLRWRIAAKEKPDHYKVTVEQAFGKVFEAATRATTLPIDPGILHAGNDYRWTLTAYSAADGQIASADGRFEILTQSEIDKSRSDFANPALSPLDKAIAATKLGLLDKATQELDLTPDLNPTLRAKILERIEAVRLQN